MSDRDQLFSRAMAASAELLPQVLDHHRHAVAAAPGDLDARYRVADTLRQLGRLDEAVTELAAVLDRAPDHGDSATLLATLTAQPVPATRAGDACPFVRHQDFFGADGLERLWSVIEHRADAFRPARFGPDENTGHRQANVIPGSSFPVERSWCLERIEAALADALPVLGIEPFAIADREVQLTMHEHQGFLHLHRDGGPGTRRPERRLTFVYYLHRVPRRFDGGDLLLFDRGEVGAATRYTRIRPENDTLMLFPSDRFHQVTPVETTSSDPLDGRFTLNGWISAAAGYEAVSRP